MDIYFWIEEVVKLCERGFDVLTAIKIVKARIEMFNDWEEEVTIWL